MTLFKTLIVYIEHLQILIIILYKFIVQSGSLNKLWIYWSVWISFLKCFDSFFFINTWDLSFYSDFFADWRPSFLWEEWRLIWYILNIFLLIDCSLWIFRIEWIFSLQNIWRIRNNMINIFYVFVIVYFYMYRKYFICTEHILYVPNIFYMYRTYFIC